MRSRVAMTESVLAVTGAASRRPSPWRLPFAIALATVFASFVLLAIATRTSVSHEGPTRDPISMIAEPVRATQTAEPSISTDRADPTQSPTRVPALIRSLDTAQQRNLQRTLEGAPSGVSIVVARLEDGLHASVHGDTVHYAASLFKLAVLYEAERRQSLGDLEFSTAIYPDYSEDLGTSGELPTADDGLLSIAVALYYMITVSDNASAVALMRFLGASRIDETMRGLGIVDTSVNTEELPTTADDMARLMRAVITGEGVDSEAGARMRELLLGQTHQLGIPSLMPMATAVGNKTGTWEGALHDVAFVETKSGTYVIAILTDGSVGWEGIAEWGLLVFEALEG